MTSIEKLHISGIRSFNPNPSARQTIEFQKPLTIILGKNGAGKTTIIEALLNATTGEMPPGAAAGEKAAFVYDPKALGGESEVKAQIRLVFTGKGGKAMQVIRSFQATRSKGKPKFETLDAVLACKDDSSGKVQSATYRSTDCDRMVPELLGVPKAVLEHVIFCHQEDCNWPLGPPGEVKKRFDDIFASTRYVAALDKLREISKEYKDLQKDNEGVLITLREHKETAKQLTAEVDDKQEQVRIIEARNKEIEPRLKQLSAAVQSIDAESHRIETMVQEVAIVRGRVAEKERALRSLQQQRAATGHTAPPQQSLEELVVLQRDFAATMQRFSTDLAVQQGKLNAAEASRRSAANACGEARGALTALEHEGNNHKRRVAELQRLISTMTSDFVAGEGEFDAAALDRVALLMTAKVAEAQEELAQLTAQLQQSIGALKEEREKVLRFIDAEGKERDLKEAQLASLAQRIQAAQQSRPHTASPQEIEALQHEINALADQAKREALARRNGTAGREVDDLLKRIETCQRQVKELSDVLAQSKDQAETAVRMGFLRSTIAQRTAQANSTLLDVVVPSLKAVGASIPDGVPNLATATAAAAAVKQRKVKALAQAEDDARQVDRESSALQQTAQHAQQRLETVRRDVAQRRAVVANVVGSGEPDSYKRVPQLLADAEERVTRAARKLTSLQSMAKCYESFIASARTEHSCVVCKRGLDAAGVENFVRVNEERQRTTPAQIEAARQEQAEATSAVEKLRKAAPLAETMRLLLEEGDQLTAAAASAEESLLVKRAALADLTTKRRELQRQLEQVDAVVTQLARLEEAQVETDKIVRELRDLESVSAAASHGGQAAGLPPRDVLQRDYEAKASELRDLNAKLLTLQRNAAAEAAQDVGGRKVEEELLAKRTLLSELQMQLKRAEDVDQTVQALTVEANGHRARLSAIATRKAELQKSLDATSARIAEMEASSKPQLQAAQSKVAACEKNVTLLSEGSRVVKEYLNRSAASALEAARQQLRNHEAAMKHLDDEVKALNEAIANRRATIDEQHKHQQDLSDSIKLLELQREVERDKASIAKAEAALTTLRDEKLRDVAPIIGNLDGDAQESAMSVITKARDRCRAKASELERARAQNTGALETLVAAIAEKKSALQKDKYRDIDNRYAATFIKVQTTEHAIEDIEKYYRALERAVSSYHAEKVCQINKIVSDLWRTTYRGSDIDTIEIKSEDDNSSGSIARRSYKYRVVMKRGDTELDMRGRCSAGQKVLASVIIRLALSEAFCCDCGILALDEPTTNLDDDNAKALAEALRELISARRYVSHFQLVVITHDEDFVRTLGAGHRAEHFYYVQKDREGTFSTITQRRFGELFA